MQHWEGVACPGIDEPGDRELDGFPASPVNRTPGEQQPRHSLSAALPPSRGPGCGQHTAGAWSCMCVSAPLSGPGSLWVWMHVNVWEAPCWAWLPVGASGGSVQQYSQSASYVSGRQVLQEGLQISSSARGQACKQLATARVSKMDCLSQSWRMSSVLESRFSRCVCV